MIADRFAHLYFAKDHTRAAKPIEGDILSDDIFKLLFFVYVVII